MSNLVEHTDYKVDWFYSIGLLLMLFLPHFGVLFLVNPILVVLLAIYKRKPLLGHVGITLVLVLAILLSLSVNVIGNGGVSTKPVFRAIVLILCFVLFPFSENFRISKWVLYVSLLYILLSQLCNIWGLTLFSNFFSSMYANEEWQEYYERFVDSADSLSALSVFRLGGLYGNPNQCAKYVTIIFSVYCIDYFSENNKKSFPIIFLCLFSLLLAGSRTGLFVFFIILFLLLISRAKVTTWKHYFFWGLFLTGLVFIYLFSNLSSTFRAFAFSQGLNDSFSGKINFLLTYLNSDLSLGQVLFGNFYYTPENVQRYLGEITTMDSEFGISLFTYGLFFSLVYLLFFLKMFKRLKRPYSLLLIVFLWGLSSTLFFSYRASFIVLFLLSKYYTASEGIKTQNNGE